MTTPTTEVHVFADITCPFTHVGLKQVVRHVEEMAEPAAVVVRAWPLEWVNGTPLDVDAVLVKAAALHDQLGVDDFAGLRADRWPRSTIPALNLVARAYERDAVTGLAVSLELRAALFEEGVDVADPDALALVAAGHHLQPTAAELTGAVVHAAVQRDYDDGRARCVAGSPHFFVGDDGFFCPALDLGHDADGHLTARFDRDMLAQFFARIDR
jgi:predicted DsbA family dithiol-disulfide isomerase